MLREYIIARDLNEVEDIDIYWLRWPGHGVFHKIKNYDGFIKGIKKLGYKRSYAGDCGTFGWIGNKRVAKYSIHYKVGG